MKRAKAAQHSKPRHPSPYVRKSRAGGHVRPHGTSEPGYRFIRREQKMQALEAQMAVAPRAEDWL